mgnify:CR=1 FL=1|jgi:hypothetical protein
MQYVSIYDFDQTAVKHEVKYNNSGDAEYVSSLGRYGRLDASSREYCYNGVNYGNDYNSYISAMDKDNYDVVNPANLSINENSLSVEARNIAQQQVYIIAMESPLNAIRTLAKYTRSNISEATRLLNLKSKRSHNTAYHILDNINAIVDYMNELKMSTIELERQKKEFDLSATAINYHYENAKRLQKIGVEYDTIHYEDNRKKVEFKNNQLINVETGMI